MLVSTDMEQQVQRYMTATALFVVSLQMTQQDDVNIADYTPPMETMVERVRMLDQISPTDDTGEDMDEYAEEEDIDDSTDSEVEALECYEDEDTDDE